MGVSENRLHPEFMAIEIGLPNDTNQPVDVFFFPRFSRDKPINPICYVPQNDLHLDFLRISNASKIA
jgi:phenolic acid decarboxylase